jgi:hypothetical protein
MTGSCHSLVTCLWVTRRIPLHPSLARLPACPSAYLIKKPTNPKILLSADRLPSTSSFVLYIYLTDPSIVPPLAPSH